MTYEIDHLFICASAGGPEAERLIDIGLTEGSPNEHPGQGTANRRFFFENAMLELVWVADDDEARGDMAAPTKLWERWVGRDGECSPFGIAFRPGPAGGREPPFATWAYRPGYLPGELAIDIADDTLLAEPMWFFLGFARRADAARGHRREPLQHAMGIRKLTGVRVVTPFSDPWSPAAQRVIETGLVDLSRGEDHLLELTFDGAERGRQADFRPVLPLTMRW